MRHYHLFLISLVLPINQILKLVIQKAGGSYELMLNQLKKDIISAKTKSALMGLVKN